MEIKKVYLENIRSYKEAEIEFPAGRVLLSGDIGSGKSSILLAVEFALFGLQKGSLSGSSLLRNGNDYGKVRVNFEIDGQDIILERSLKRTSKGVSQDSGAITINKDKKEVAVSELKNYVLRMLNYPQEFMTKKPELYRYTVYTPQEEMKQILVENAETRLDTLRRVFAIDKYKRINENITLFLTRLRENIRNKEGMIVDIDYKKENLNIKKAEKDKIEISLKEVLPLLEKATANWHEKKNELKEIEKKLKEIETLKRTIVMAYTEVTSKQTQQKAAKKVLAELEKEVEVITGKNVENTKEIMKILPEKIMNKNMVIKGLNADINEINKKKASLETKKEQSEKLKRNFVVLRMDNCPTCNQKVTADYKKQFIDKMDMELKILDQDLQTHNSSIREKMKLIDKEEKEFKELQEKEKLLAKADIAMVDIERKKKELKRFEEDINVNNTRYNDMKARLNDMKDVDEKAEIIKRNVEEAQEQQKQVEIKKAQITEQIRAYNNSIKELELEIAKKENIKLTIEKCNKIKDWLNEQFVPMIAVIEKNVMMKLHHEFNILFEKWFNMLVASEGLRARLDENFTPIIEQAGYDIDYAFLSGGERTAAALAYRLALNQVINSMLSHIKTRDLLILDEPTDGFSSEQLDKMKDVLSEISAKQIILVSHESKIENFVDNIIRFSKQGHISKAL